MGGSIVTALLLAILHAGCAARAARVGLADDVPQAIEFPEETSDERQEICVQWGVRTEEGGDEYPYRCLTVANLRALLFPEDEAPVRELLFGSLALIAGAAAQAQVITLPIQASFSSMIEWDHDGINADRFVLIFDGKPADVGKPVKQGALGVYAVPFPQSVPGNHKIAVQACNADGCATSSELQVQVTAVPIAPTGVRIVTITPLPQNAIGR